MKPKSISGLVCYVNNLDATADFYEKLGFRPGKREANSLTVYVNWFSIKFIVKDLESSQEFQNEAKSNNKGLGIFVSVSVESADEYYEYVLSQRLKPATEPQDMASGAREFIIRDPDGYKLAFFQKS